MRNKEIEDNTYKISIPLMTNTELEDIKNYQSELVEQISKSAIKDKELLICQKIIKNQEEQIQTLQRDFEQVDHECSRLEQIDIEKDLEIKKLNKIIDNAIKYNMYLKEHCKYRLNEGHLRKLNKILRGESND